MNGPRTAVLGLAGHVDHGKTALVRALTGHDGDRLPEEKKRGITMELGFSRWELGGTSLGVVDVPGHERLVHAMVAGASGFDLVLLCVAADDGVMPQTREHLAVLDELGACAGVVAITKADAVDPETLALAEHDVRESVRGTFLEHAAIVATSARTARGIDELRTALEAALAAAPRAETAGPPWLSIDRAFSKAGFGTIATGTLVRGAIAEGDALELLSPRGVENVAVRGLAVHGAAVPRAAASTRLAVNLRGIEPDRVPRGAVLTSPGWQGPTTAIDAELHVLPGVRRPGPRTDVVLHVGTEHVTARVRGAPEAGARGVVRLTLQHPIAIHAGQRFVLRRPELVRDRTLAGGIVVDPHPPAGRRKPTEVAATASPPERLFSLVSQSQGAVSEATLRGRMPPGVDLAAAIGRLVSSGRLVREGGLLAAPIHLERARAAVLAALAAFHREHPALGGAPTEDLVGRTPVSARPLLAAGLRTLVAEGLVLAHGGGHALASHDPGATRERIATAFREAGLVLGGDEAIREALELPARLFRDLVAELVRERTLVRLATGLHVHAAPLDELVSRVRAHLDRAGTLSPGDFKELSGLTRKNAITLLEHLDRAGVTRRDGDRRVRA